MGVEVVAGWLVELVGSGCLWVVVAQPDMK